jgi:serine protease Do
MSGRTIKLVAIIAVVAIVFSAFNTYLILDSIRVQEQLSAQEKKIDDLQASLAQLGIQNEQLAGLQDVINAQEERLNELQTALDNLSVSGEQLNVQQQQLNTQQTQISELQSALDATRGDIEEVTSNLSNLTDQMSALDQSTSTSLAEFGTTLENIKGLISELTDLENMVNQLLDQTPQQVYEDAYRSVVVIRTPLGLGSGFLFGDSNIIVTNYHVVAEETDIEIEFFDRTRTQATVIGSDAYSDVAVLTVPNAPAGATPLVFSEQTDVHIGQQVVAIGNPLGLAESLSVGYISQVNRTLDIEPIIVPVLQLDLTIAPGSSGGPLLDLSGNVVGITNAGTDVGFNFAVPLNILRRVIPALITEGEYVHPFIGVYPLALTPEVVAALNILNVDAYQNGLLVMAVVPDFPAAEAGLNPAVSGDQGYTAVDIILAVDGYPMFLEDDLTAYMEFEVSPGQVITLTLWRSGVTSSVTLTTTERPPYQAS